MTDLHAIGMERRRFASDRFREDLEKARDLFLRSSPVLGREGKDRDHLDSAGATRFKNAPQILGASAVPEQARLTALLCPTPVAIHDERHVTGRPHGRVCRFRVRPGTALRPAPGCLAPESGDRHDGRIGPQGRGGQALYVTKWIVLSPKTQPRSDLGSASAKVTATRSAVWRG